MGQKASSCQQNESRLLASEMRFLRWTPGSNRSERIGSSLNVRNLSPQESAAKTMERREPQWFGLVMSTDERKCTQTEKEGEEDHDRSGPPVLRSWLLEEKDHVKSQKSRPGQEGVSDA